MMVGLEPRVALRTKATHPCIGFVDHVPSGPFPNPARGLKALPGEELQRAVDVIARLSDPLPTPAVL